MPGTFRWCGIRLGFGLDVVSSGKEVAAASQEVAREIDPERRHHGAQRHSVDRFPFSATDELRTIGLGGGGRYCCIGHGLGMSGEWPNISHVVPGIEYPLTGFVETGMVICIESYFGCAASAQGVKLEDQS